MAADISSHNRMKNRSKLAQILLIVLLLLGTFYIGDNVVGSNLFRGTTNITVQLDNAGGLHPRSTVNYRGQRVGVVTSIELVDREIVAHVEFDPGVEVPRNSAVEVRNLSAVGEQYLDFRPRTNDGPYFADGDTIAATRTPLAVDRVLAHVNAVVGSIDLRDLETITRETEAIFAGDDIDLRQLTGDLNETVALLTDLEPQITHLINQAAVPLQMVSDLDPMIRSLSRDARLVMATLRQATPTIAGLLNDVGDLMPLLRQVWTRLSPQVADLIDSSLPTLLMSQSHLPGLRHWLAWGTLQAKAMAGSTRNGTGHVILVAKILKNCIYPGDHRTAYQLKPRPPQLDRRCVTEAAGIQQRGSQYAPRP